MEVENANSDDRKKLFRLFERCFGNVPSQAIWQWKYDQYGVGVVAREGSEIIAHYGAWVRKVSFEGESGRAWVPMDVMVAPEKRGVLRKQNGLMGQTARYLFAQPFDDGNACRLAMGFPTLRARTLGEKLGLYVDGSAVNELSWPPRPSTWREQLTLQMVLLNRDDLDEWITPLWHAMAKDFRDLVISVRDAAWVRYRYFEHPEKNYTVLGIRTRLGGKKLGAAVVREDETGALECMDLIAPRSAMPQLIIALQHYCSVRDRMRLYLWINQRLRAILMTSDVEVLDRDMRLTVTVAPKSEYYAHRWWITSGDTDFR